MAMIKMAMIKMAIFRSCTYDLSSWKLCHPVHDPASQNKFGDSNNNNNYCCIKRSVLKCTIIALIAYTRHSPRIQNHWLL